MYTHNQNEENYGLSYLLKQIPSDYLLVPENFSQILNDIHTASWNLNLDTQIFNFKFVYADGMEWKDFQLSFLASSVVNLIHPDDRQNIYTDVQSSMTNGESFFTQSRINQEVECWIEIVGKAHLQSHIISGKVLHITKSVLNHRRREQELLSVIQKTEIANKNKSHFLANMSHEIRSPLSAILGFSDILSEDQLATDKQRHYIEIIRRNGKALTKIIDDVLDLSKVESGNLKLETLEFSFPELIDEVALLFKDMIQAKQLTLICYTPTDFPSKIISDSGRLRQVMVNLVSNAIKFTTKGSITLDTHFHLLPNNQIEIDFKVKDTGIGLTEEQKKTLFTPYVQADTTISRRFGGTGLGLALSQKLAHALNGQLMIDPAHTENGSCFKFTFKTTLAAHCKSSLKMAPLQIAPIMQNPLTGLNILLVEDSEDTQFLIGRIFKSHGINLQIANDGEEALRKNSNDSFDLVLMDIKLPKISGYEVTRILRSQGYVKPIIALTAHAMENEKKLSLYAGCDAHLTKPINIQNLFTTMDRFIKNKK
ncbi:MAG: response regulator [Bdellovibrionaceae bacterium]|nr:response regulator [Pseudobdellovibrionaceae bacterium]